MQIFLCIFFLWSNNKPELTVNRIGVNGSMWWCFIHGIDPSPKGLGCRCGRKMFNDTMINHIFDSTFNTIQSSLLFYRVSRPSYVSMPGLANLHQIDEEEITNPPRSPLAIQSSSSPNGPMHYSAATF